jgi:SAM-dependent methyltransferase
MSNFKMPAHGHDIADGEITNCQVCGSDNLALIIELGHQPLCDSLLSEEQLKQPEVTYPLNFWRCKDCSLTQIDHAVKSDVVYHPDYPYKSSVTREVVTHMGELSQQAVKKLQLAPGSFVIDIGSNDGTLLKAFQNQGMKVCGVEPTNIATFAQADGVETCQAFFNEETAKQIVESHGKCDLMTSTNVFAHMSNLGQVLRGAKMLVKDSGTFIVEIHYLVNILKNTQYDSVYHEHLRTYSLKSLVVLFDMYGFTVVDAEVTERYSGTIRVYANNNKNATVQPSVKDLLDRETAFGIHKPEVYAEFTKRVEKSKFQLLQLALEAKAKGQSFVGNSCPGRCSTLLNYVGISPDLMPYIGEQSTSLKLNLHLPGKHIPIVNNQRLIDDQPDYVVLLAWHYAGAIRQELRERGLRSKLVMPLPEVTVIDDYNEWHKSHGSNTKTETVA